MKTTVCIRPGAQRALGSGFDAIVPVEATNSKCLAAAAALEGVGHFFCNLVRPGEASEAFA